MNQNWTLQTINNSWWHRERQPKIRVDATSYLTWKVWKCSTSVYSYGEVTRVDGVPVAIEWVYIGKSINLKKRIEQGHDSHRESNPELWRWMGQLKRNRELWFAYVEIDNLDTVERLLISEIKPKFNRNLKK